MSSLASNPRPLLPTFIVAGLSAVAILALWTVGAGGILRLFYPAAATLVACLLLRIRPSWYLRFTLWIWFLSPFVRRMVDWRAGWAEPNLILVAPLLVSAVSALTLLRRDRDRPITSIPFLLCGAGVLYGLIVGVALKPSLETVYGLFNWASPILLGLHLASHWRTYPINRRAILSTFCWGALVLGAYGLYQFFVAPEWDIYWLNNITQGLIDPSFGHPEPLGMRIWSTMNSAGPFANMLIASMILLLIAKQRFTWIFMLAAALPLLITSVRTAWLSCVIGLVLLLRGVPGKTMLKGLASLLIVAALLVPLANLPLTGPLIRDRFSTFQHLKSDESFNERADMYRTLFTKAQQDPFGHGLRNQEIIGNLVVDSGILTMLFSLGWTGTLLYLSGIGVLLFRRGQSAKSDTFIWACLCCCFMYLAQIVGTNLFVGSTGTFFWTFAGTALAGNAYHRAHEAEDRQAATSAGETLMLEAQPTA